MSLRDFLKELNDSNLTKQVSKKVSPEYEAAKILDQEEKTVIFENIKDKNLKIVGNLYSSREKIGRGLGINPEKLTEKLNGAMNKKESNIKTEYEFQTERKIKKNPNLNKIPILTHFEKDAGPYLTTSIVVAEKPNNKFNLSYHRMLKLSEKKLAVRIVPRDLYKLFEDAKKENRDLKVAIIMGVDPAIAISAASSPPSGISEYELASKLKDEIKLVSIENGLKVPKKSEIIMTGKILKDETAKEGPFTDVTGTYDIIREEPVLEIEKIIRKKDAFYPALVPSTKDHRNLMGIPKEPIIFEKLQERLEVKDVNLTSGGCGWLHCIINIEKKSKKDGEKAIQLAFEAHPSLKHVVVVDEDIDIYDESEVEWAIATRSRADKDSIIFSNKVGSSLDLTSDPETRKGGKMGIDATKPLENSKKFNKASFPK